MWIQSNGQPYYRQTHSNHGNVTPSPLAVKVTSKMYTNDSALDINNKLISCRTKIAKYDSKLKALKDLANSFIIEDIQKSSPEEIAQIKEKLNDVIAFLTKFKESKKKAMETFSDNKKFSTDSFETRLFKKYSAVENINSTIISLEFGKTLEVPKACYIEIAFSEIQNRIIRLNGKKYFEVLNYKKLMADQTEAFNKCFCK